MSKQLSYGLLQCPNCRGTFKVGKDLITCNNCELSILITDEKILFKDNNIEDSGDELNQVKGLLKRNHLLYDFLIKVISPICPSNAQRDFINKYIKGKNVVAINFGSGNSDISPDVSNADFFNYKNVDMTCDILNIPLIDNSVDFLLNVAVLEHVTNPEIAVAEFNRILKRGGKIFVNFPFIQGFHSSPHDYSRRTSEGMAELFKDFEIETIGVAGGPTSGLLWIIQEWFSIIFSFGSKTLHKYLYILFMLVTFPIKYLDLILKWHPRAGNITSNYYIIATKR